MKTILWMEAGLIDLPYSPIRTFTLDTDGFLLPVKTTAASTTIKDFGISLSLTVYWHIADLDRKTVRMMVQGDGQEEGDLIQLHGTDILEGLAESGWVEDNTYYAS